MFRQGFPVIFLRLRNPLLNRAQRAVPIHEPADSYELGAGEHGLQIGVYDRELGLVHYLTLISIRKKPLSHEKRELGTG